MNTQPEHPHHGGKRGHFGNSNGSAAKASPTA